LFNFTCGEVHSNARYRSEDATEAKMPQKLDARRTEERNDSQHLAGTMSSSKLQAPPEEALLPWRRTAACLICLRHCNGICCRSCSHHNYLVPLSRHDPIHRNRKIMIMLAGRNWQITIWSFVELLSNIVFKELFNCPVCSLNV
jgi:hypothetical protein